jgi:GNAT superfamily N-acetyltransferase
VTVWTLEMTEPSAVRPSREPARRPLLMRADRPAPQLSRFFYEMVGGPWHWVDRLVWTERQWQDWVEASELWTCWLDGTPAGYAELHPQGRDVELAYFGLVPQRCGSGLGGWLLTRVLQRAWRLPGTRRVWVHTCSLDAPAALPNYEARGFVRCGETTEANAAP